MAYLIVVSDLVHSESPWKVVTLGSYLSLQKGEPTYSLQLPRNLYRYEYESDTK